MSVFGLPQSDSHLLSTMHRARRTLQTVLARAFSAATLFAFGSATVAAAANDKPVSVMLVHGACRWIGMASRARPSGEGRICQAGACRGR